MAFADVWLAAVRGSNCKISRGLSYSVLVLANSLNCRDARGTRQINRGICQLSNPGIPYSGRSQEAIRRLGTYKQFKWDPSLNVGLHNHYTPARLYASPRRKDQLVESSDKGAVSTTTEKVKQAGKDVTYTGIVLLGIGVTGVMFFAIGRELLSSQSPSGIYSAAFKRCKNNVDIQDLVGLPMKGYGETTRRGRRRHVSHTEYERDGYKFLRMKFYIEGPMAKGTVQLEMKKGESGKWEYRYLFVDVDSFPRRTIIIEDNR